MNQDVLVALSLLSLALGIFGATFAALVSLQRFFGNYLIKGWNEAGNHLKNVKDNSKESKATIKAIACRYTIAVCYILWSFTLFATTIIFGYFAFKFSNDAVHYKEITDTQETWNECVGDIAFMQKAFIFLFVSGIVFLLLFAIANTVLTSMSEMAETKATKDAFGEQNEDDQQHASN